MLASAKTEVSFLFSYDPAHPEQPATRRIIELSKRDADINPVKWGGLVLPGGGGRTAFMLALAADSAPDIYKAWFHILRHDVEQGFAYPLDEWTGPARPGGDIWERVRQSDGHVWALAEPSVAYYGIIYNKALARSAGMDPESPPHTWNAFREWCGKLASQGCTPFAIENRAGSFLPWVQSAGGDVVRERSPGEWEACFDSPESVRAAEFLQELVRSGLAETVDPAKRLETQDAGKLFANGKIAAVFGGEDLVRRLTETLNFPPEEIGMMPFPAADAGGCRILQAHRHFYAMCESVGRRPKAERDKVWKCLSALVSPDLADEEVRRNVAEGRIQWCRPADLKRLGYAAELEKMPRGILEMYEDMEKGDVKAATEPWVGFWQPVGDLVQRRFLGLLSSDGAPLDCASALASITEEANRGLMFDTDRSHIDRARPVARVVLGAILACLLIAAFLVFREKSRRRPKDGSGVSCGRRPFRIAPWLFLAPAVVSILVWSYYPLFKGAMMAFQDYKVVGETEWTGLGNFIRVSMDLNFWKAWGRTLEYVGITLLLGFLSPVVLALMLTEIPRGKVFFRFLYFLPHLTSALVVTLLWKLMFEKGPNGILNRALALFGAEPRSWLQDPALAMVCCILPGVWAGAGISSLIYIAAIESLPRDYYEASAMDGAGILARFRHIALPQILPLMVINFVGAFIAAFQGMGSIFLLTFGGPGDATQVVSLQIWKEAYNNLRFSTATTMAWFLGVALIAFTYLQIRLLRRVEFRQASMN